jgi:hypothetical protein
MIFYHGYKPSRHLLNQTTIDLMDKAFYSRRAKGLNVQFINAGSNDLDEWSFANLSQKNRFVDRLEQAGLDYAISN